MEGETKRTVTTLVFTTILIGAGLYFLYSAISLMSTEPPHVAASLLATIIGLSLISAGVTLLRTWIVTSSITSREELQPPE